MKKKVMVGMSGGVDSSVAAFLLKEQGYDVIGVNMKMWQFDENHLKEINDARKVADNIGIPFYIMDFKDIFKRDVIDYFICEYIEGRTPNPCIACNKFVKFDAFLKKAMDLGVEYIATGHYAKIEKVGTRFLLKKSVDDKKDQTYVLYNLSQFVLQHTLMPCSSYSKDEIRRIAKEIGIQIHDKKDSEEICFIPDNNHGAYIKRNAPDKVKEGNFVDKTGKILGKHKGIVYYTIGQRKGLGISFGKPVYVIDINPWKNEVVLGSEEDIFKKELIAKDVNYIPFDKLNEKMKVQVKVRYSAKPTPAVIMPYEDKVKVVFEKKVRAITKGQSVVFYDDDIVVGGGIICDSL